VSIKDEQRRSDYFLILYKMKNGKQLLKMWFDIVLEQREDPNTKDPYVSGFYDGQIKMLDILINED